MSSNVTNTVPFLRTTREFPSDVNKLTLELNKSYLDIANSVNSRTIGIYPTTVSAVTGDAYFLNANVRQQTLRQVYTFTTTGSIPHNIRNLVPGQMVRGFGSYTDGTATYGVLYGTSVAILGQVSFYVTSTNIVVLSGAGAPAITSGRVVIEWLSAP